MHVKQINTSQALQTIPRKSKCVSRRKSFTSLLSWKSDRRRRNCHDLRVIWGHGTVILHIPQIYCNTLLSTNSTASILREEPVLAGLTHTPTEQNITTMGDLIIAMCFQMVCYDSEQQEDYNTRYSISLASEDNQKLYCTVKTLPRPKNYTHTANILPSLSRVSSYPAADVFCMRVFTTNHHLYCWQSAIAKRNGMCSGCVSPNFVSLCQNWEHSE